MPTNPSAANACESSEQMNPVTSPSLMRDEMQACATDLVGSRLENRMVRARLGLANGLYLAIRAKHPPTAAHSLRVALGCSKWAGWRKMSAHDRDLLEITALLHDIGKIGIPDRVLQKPASLVGEESSLMNLQCQVAAEILRGAGAGDELVDIVSTYRQWFDSRSGVPGSTLSIQARMISIVDAFDSMTTEQVYRRAMSRERASAELFGFAGTQFDPQLVKEFSCLISQPMAELEAHVVHRWLNELRHDATPGFWESDVHVASGATQKLIDTLYHNRLLDSTSDGVVYVDTEGRILHWNRATERMTGRNSSLMMHQVWNMELMGLVDENGREISPNSCPLQEVFTTQVQSIHRLQVRHQDGRMLKVNMHLLPVCRANREVCGAIFLIRDASAEAHLEERVQSLHERATRDPLTGVANRAELNRQLPEFVSLHLESELPGSMIICDIDHFKRINDNYGHQAGDEALQVFGTVLRDQSRSGDIVARYGGEEFVILCAACDNATATIRAEQIRRDLENRAVPSLRGNSMTASFGVTEVQSGDTDESFLARADRALLLAKDTGRNRVVQLGHGTQEKCQSTTTSSGWFGWFGKKETSTALVEKEYLTAVPLDVAVQKLSGFINDHQAEVIKIEQARIAMKIDCKHTPIANRSGDRSLLMTMDVNLERVLLKVQGRRESTLSKTKITVSLNAPKVRERRRVAVIEQANLLLASFQAYLVAQEIDEKTRELLTSL